MQWRPNPKKVVTLQTVSKKPQNRFLVSDSHGNQKAIKANVPANVWWKKSENFSIITRQSVLKDGCV